MKDKFEVLHQYYGYTSFREGQAELIDAQLSGRDVFGIMPTGGGKSVCYQIPALMMDGITLVVSPLISLMKDQVSALKNMGVPAAYVNSSLSSEQVRIVLRNIQQQKYKIIYIAPERLLTENFLSAINNLKIAMLAVDEAHCISQWGQDFRPSYLRIAGFLRLLKYRPVISAFTATATYEVREDVERILELQNPLRVITGYDRPNLRFEVVKPRSKPLALQELVEARLTKSGIIYCSTRKEVEKVCLMLKNRGISATRYHAGLPDEERLANQDDFIYDRCKVMVATNAFGMGIDKSNVGYVIHYNLPQSIEAYYQEAGRAGRDGEKADCILLYSAADIRTAKYLIQQPAENKDLSEEDRNKVIKRELIRLDAMIGYCNTDRCLRGYILEYFGQKHQEMCGNCANCAITAVEYDITECAKMILSCIQRIYDYLGYSLGVTLVVRVLHGSTAIFNADSIPIEMKAPQYFIDLPVEGHILGALWILSIGLELDKNSDENNPNGMYEHSYGNRLRKTLINKESNDITFSPSLFEPYFAQYESWRDYGLERAKERLDDKQDAIILTLDFKSFYYSVHMDEGDFQKFLSRVPEVHAWHKRVNDFVFRVISKYSDKLRRAIGCESELIIGDRNVLPIGFLPSNILGNWILTGFDDAIIEKWNPVYYGRYVDDIIIVDKVEKNSPLYKKAREKTPTERLTSDDVIRFELVDKRILAQIPGSEEQSDTSGNETPGTETNQVTYKIDADVLSYNGCEITVQSQKVKLFYFQSGSTQALLNCFKTKIAQNASEFRLLPNMDSVLRHRNYSEIFDLRNEEGINKFRGITGIELDKFALSKFLGKYRKVSGMIQSKEENEFEKDLMLILDERTLISNYGTWERLFEILILNNRYDLYKQLAIRIVDAIERYSVPEDMCNASVKTHDSLLRVFLSAMQRTTAIVWNADIDRVLDAVCEKVGKLRGNPKYTQALITMFDKETIYTTRTAYCETRMVNKYLLPLPIDCVINNLGKEEANLSVFADMLRMMDTTWLEEDSKRKRVYYPYMVLPQEISFALTCKDLLANTESIDPESQHKSVNSMFIRLNYPLADTEKRKIFSLKKIETGVMSQIASARNLYFTSVDSAPKSEKDKLTIAVGSVKLSVKDFTDVLDGRPNRGYERYEQFAKVFDEAINQKADMLVLPENFLPFEWIPSVARMCANNQLALITGIEHFVVPQQGCNGQVYNLTLVILPYECDDYRFAYVSYHNKVAYAPIEISEIRGRRYTYKEGNAYQLFGWHNVWFPVYCCFELASIQDRAIFQEYADMVVAVEWNKDVPYYSNIIESLSRDLHCYCVQVTKLNCPLIRKKES